MHGKSGELAIRGTAITSCCIIDSVELSPQFLLIGSGFIDIPAPGSVLDSYVLRIVGWVTGNLERPVYVEVKQGSYTIRTARVIQHRPDVSAEYPGYPESDSSGFEAPIIILGLPEHFSLTVVVVFGDGQEEKLGAIVGRRLRFLPIRTKSVLTPIVVSTVGRSGSTLLMKMLSGLPEVVVVGKPESLYEVSFSGFMLKALNVMCSPATFDDKLSNDTTILTPFPYVGSKYMNENILRWHGYHSLHNTVSFIHEQIRSYYTFAAVASRKPSPRYFAEKVSAHLFQRLVFREIYPDCKEIVNIRHPYDTIVSSVRFFGKTVDDQEFEFRRELFLCLIQTLETLGDSVFVLRYEDLILEPVETLSALLKYLEIDGDLQDTVDLMLAQSDTLAKELTGHITSSSIASSVGRWKAELTDRELLRKCHYYFDDIIEKLGYSE